MPGMDLRRPLASSLSKSPGKINPEVDAYGVFQREACLKLAVKFHQLPGLFDLVLLVYFHEDG